MMNQQHAWTVPSPIYPEFVNFMVDGDDIIVTVRGSAAAIDGVAICGQNCRPGDALCNNYCNRAPDKGPMADMPPTMTHHKCGETVAMRIPRAALVGLVKPLTESAS